MLLEIHCHSEEHSACSYVSASQLVRRVAAKGLQGVVLTDHHYLWKVAELAELRRQAEVPDHFLILSGQEVHTPELGDVLVYGATRSYPRDTPLAELRAAEPQAALVWAHPYRKGRIPRPAELSHPALDAVEIFNANQTVRENARGLQDWHRLRFTALAGTDTHGAAIAGLYPTLFDHPVKDIAELAAEIRAGHCRPFIKEIPKAGSHHQVTEVTIGAKGEDEVRERLIIKTLGSRGPWRRAERAHRLQAQLVEAGFAGGVYRVPHPIDRDAASRTLITQGVRGKSLYDRLLSVPRSDGRHCLQLAAGWLARLHNQRLQLTPTGEFLAREEQRLNRYLERFTAIGHPHTRRAAELRDTLWELTGQLLASGAASVQGHGDYHPKNILIGQDRQDDPSTRFVAAIDFESSLVLPPAFDVGCFLAQFRNQFYQSPEVRQRYPEAIFLESYLEQVREPAPDFKRQLELFRARTNLGIAAYLIKLGRGGSEDLWRLLVEAEQALTLHWSEPQRA